MNKTSAGDMRQRAVPSGGAARSGEPAAKVPTRAGRASAWALGSHVRGLFERGESGARFFPLDGMRAMLCLWMMAFHTLFYMHYFQTDAEASELNNGPFMKWVALGFLPVDGFFVLTGFLVAYPLVASGGSGPGSGPGPSPGPGRAPPPSSSAPEGVEVVWYRRFARMVPVYLVCLVIFSLDLLGPRFRLDQVRSEFELTIIRDFHFAEKGDTYPSGCEAGGWVPNVLFTNNLLPFAGCMGYSWSLAVQFQFYMLMPLLWGRVVLGAGSVPDPAARLGRAALLGLGLSWLWRLVSFWNLTRHPLSTVEGVFFHFFWYTHTLNRSGVLLLGVALACVVARGDLATWLAGRSWARALGWLLCAAVLAAQLGWAALFPPGEKVGMSLPGSESVASVRASPGDWPNAALQAAHHSLFIVGAPLSGFVFAFLVLVATSGGGVGSAGRALGRLWSWRGWFPIAQLSYWAYLLHPIVISVLTSGPLYPPSSSQADFARLVLIVWVLTLSLSAVLYVLVERPLDVVLRARPPSPAALRVTRLVVYVLMAASALHHVGMTTVVLAAPPKEVQHSNASAS